MLSLKETIDRVIILLTLQMDSHHRMALSPQASLPAQGWKNNQSRIDSIRRIQSRKNVFFESWAMLGWHVILLSVVRILSLDRNLLQTSREHRESKTSSQAIPLQLDAVLHFFAASLVG
jgi:hypothetical protein